MKVEHPRFVAAAVTAALLYLVWWFSMAIRFVFPYLPPLLVLATLLGLGYLGANEYLDFRFLQPSRRRIGFLLLAWIAFRIVVPHQAIAFDGPTTSWTETYCLGLPVAVAHTAFVVVAYLAIGGFTREKSSTPSDSKSRRVEIQGEPRPE